MLWHAHKTQKRGHAAEEYEDAFAGVPQAGRWAVADGASESSFADVWAGALVEGFVRSPAVTRRRWDRWLPPLQRRWSDQVGGRPLPWYAEAKLQQGAFAAFLGLTLAPGRWSGPGLWRAVAVGDCCLFHVRGADLLRAFPVARSDGFGTTPDLIGSRSDPARAPVLRARGGCHEGDLLMLMTDALSQWFLRCFERGQRPWDTIRDVLHGPAPASAFAIWVEGLRDARSIRNDDVTVVLIEA